MQQLAPGSAWADDGAVVEDDGFRVTNTHGNVIAITAPSGTGVVAFSADLLAVIDRAGLDPVRVAARELCESIANNDEGQDFSRETLELFGKLIDLL